MEGQMRLKWLQKILVVASKIKYIHVSSSHSVPFSILQLKKNRFSQIHDQSLALWDQEGSREKWS
jgi:hypothetical protein